MTMQTSDSFAWRDGWWTITDVVGQGWWGPELLGIETEAPSSACWRGWIASFGIRDGRIVMTEAAICFRRRPGALMGPTLVALDASTSIEVGRFVFTEGALCTIGSGEGVELRLEHPALAPRHVLVGLKGTLRDAGIPLPNPVSTFEPPPGDPKLARLAAQMRPPFVVIDQGSVAGTSLGSDRPGVAPVRLRGAAALEWGAALHVPGFRVVLWSSPSPSGGPLFGVVPTYEDGFSVYRAISEPVAFTGHVVLGRGAVESSGGLGGYARSSEFERVVELHFEDGRFVEER